MRKLNVLLVVPPLRGKVSFYPPFGALSMIAVAKQEGHNAHLLDLDADRCSYKKTIERILSYSPDVIGISAVVSTAYKYVKEISALIKKQMPKVLVVIGGGLCAAADTVLNNTNVDVVVHGEGEITFKELLKRIEKKEGFREIKGISFKLKGQIFKTLPREPIKNLDILPFPDYDLINLDKYILNIHGFTREMNKKDLGQLDERVRDINRSPKFLRVNISRGCVNRCTFCYRNTPGLRTHSFNYIGNLIEQVINKYDIGHISFGDECFGPTQKWLWGFIDMIKERKFDLTYHITGMRVAAIDEDIMKALKEIGVWHIQFGFESGSQKILNIMEKNTTVEQNINAAQLARKVGINTVPFLIIGYPGETIETLHETMDFVKKADLLSGVTRPTFPMAMPGTPLYEYAKLNGFIKDEEKYLEAISDLDTTILSEENYFINYTEESSSAVLSWLDLFNNEKKGKKMYKLTRMQAIKQFLNKAQKIGFYSAFFVILRRILKKINILTKKIKPGKKNIYVLKKINMAPEGESLRKINNRIYKVKVS